MSLIMGKLDVGMNSSIELSTLNKTEHSTRHWKARADFSRTARSLLPHHINRYTIMLIMSISILKASIAIMIFPIRKIYLFPNNNNIFVRKNEFL